MMRKANKLGAASVLIIGPDEQAAGTVTVKNMQSSDVQVLKLTDLPKFLK